MANNSPLSLDASEVEVVKFNPDEVEITPNTPQSGVKDAIARRKGQYPNPAADVRESVARRRSTATAKGDPNAGTQSSGFWEKSLPFTEGVGRGLKALTPSPPASMNPSDVGSWALRHNPITGPTFAIRDQMDASRAATHKVIEDVGTNQGLKATRDAASIVPFGNIITSGTAPVQDYAEGHPVSDESNREGASGLTQAIALYGMGKVMSKMSGGGGGGSGGGVESSTPPDGGGSSTVPGAGPGVSPVVAGPNGLPTSPRPSGSPGTLRSAVGLEHPERMVGGLYKAAMDSAEEVRAAARLHLDENIPTPSERGTSYRGTITQISNLRNTTGAGIEPLAEHLDNIRPVDLRKPAVNLVNEVFQKQMDIVKNAKLPTQVSKRMVKELVDFRREQLGALDETNQPNAGRSALVNRYRDLSKAMSTGDILGEKVGGTVKAAMKDLRNGFSKLVSTADPDPYNRLGADMRKYSLLTKMQLGTEAAYLNKFGAPLETSPFSTASVTQLANSMKKGLLLSPWSRSTLANTGELVAGITRKTVDPVSGKLVREYDPQTQQRMRNFKDYPDPGSPTASVNPATAPDTGAGAGPGSNVPPGSPSPISVPPNIQPPSGAPYEIFPEQRQLQKSVNWTRGQRPEPVPEPGQGQVGGISVDQPKLTGTVERTGPAQLAARRAAEDVEASRQDVARRGGGVTSRQPSISGEGTVAPTSRDRLTVLQARVNKRFGSQPENSGGELPSPPPSPVAKGGNKPPKPPKSPKPAPAPVPAPAEAEVAAFGKNEPNVKSVPHMDPAENEAAFQRDTAAQAKRMKAREAADRKAGRTGDDAAASPVRNPVPSVASVTRKKVAAPAVPADEPNMVDARTAGQSLNVDSKSGLKDRLAASQTTPKPEPPKSSAGTRTSAEFKIGDGIEVGTKLGKQKVKVVTVGQHYSQVEVTDLKGNKTHVNMPNETLNKYHAEPAEPAPEPNKPLAEGLGGKLKAAVEKVKSGGKGTEFKTAKTKQDAALDTYKESKVGTTTPKGTVTNTFTNKSGATVHRIENAEGKATIVHDDELNQSDLEAITKEAGRGRKATTRTEEPNTESTPSSSSHKVGDKVKWTHKSQSTGKETVIRGTIGEFDYSRGTADIKDATGKWWSGVKTEKLQK